MVSFVPLLTIGKWLSEPYRARQSCSLLMFNLATSISGTSRLMLRLTNKGDHMTEYTKILPSLVKES